VFETYGTPVSGAESSEKLLARQPLEFPHGIAADMTAFVVVQDAAMTLRAVVDGGKEAALFRS